MMKNMYDSVIIGSGQAGLTAAIYLSRAGLKNIIINSEVLIIFLIKSNYVFSISYILPLERFYFLFEK